jgi:hypothetical protein
MLWHVTEFPSFFRPNNIPFCVSTTFLFIHLSVGGHLGCSHVLIPVSDATVNMHVQIPGQDPTFNSFEYLPRHRIAGSYDSSLFNCFPQQLHHFTLPQTVHNDSKFCTPSLTLVFCVR